MSWAGKGNKTRQRTCTELVRRYGPRAAALGMSRANDVDSAAAVELLVAQAHAELEAERRAQGPHIVVTVPRERWDEWIGEGDLAGDPPSDREHAFCVFGDEPPAMASRLYIVAHGHLRGYAPIIRIDRKLMGRGKGAYGKGGWLIIRQGGAVACTIHAGTPGFPGWRKKWWSDEQEIPWTQWRHAHGLRPALPGYAMPYSE